jgi:hypothetical protein
VRLSDAYGRGSQTQATPPMLDEAEAGRNCATL